MNTRFDLSPRLRPVAVPGRVAAYTARAIIGYDDHGPCYRAQARDDLGRTIYGFVDGEERWTTEPPPLRRACAGERP